MSDRRYQSGHHNISAEVGQDRINSVVEGRIEEKIQFVIDNPPDDDEMPGQQDARAAIGYALACLYMNQQVDRANELINAYCEHNPIEPVAHFAMYPDNLFRLYLLPRSHRLLTDTARRNIEKMARNWIYVRSRIDPLASSWNNASRGVWHITASENHDASWNACNILAAQILRQAETPYGPEMKLADGSPVEEHYQAWVDYWKENFRQRAREGFNCEIAHPADYEMQLIGCWYSVADLAESADLKKAGQDCLDLFWAKIACEFEPRTGIRSAWACTRGYVYTWHETGSISWSRSLLYAYGWHDHDVNPTPMKFAMSSFTSSYRVPNIVRAIARDTDRGAYLATARHFGMGGKWELSDAERWGVYKILFDKSHGSSILRTLYYTPDYTLSALTFNSAKSYIELVRQSRIMGVTFSSHVDDRIMVYGFGGIHANDSLAKEYQVCFCTTNGVCGTGCMIVARDPGADPKDGVRIFVSKGEVWDNREENRDGWLFTKAGNAYCGIRIAAGHYTVEPSPFGLGYYLALGDVWSPVVIQMGRSEDYQGGFEQFKEAVKALPHSCEDGKLSHTSLDNHIYEYWINSSRMPTINGKPIDPNPAKTYDYPYLSMEHGSDVATVSYPGYDDMVLRFAY